MSGCAVKGSLVYIQQDMLNFKQLLLSLDIKYMWFDCIVVAKRWLLFGFA